MSAALDRITADVAAIHDQVEKLIALNADTAAQLRTLASQANTVSDDALNALATTLEGASADAQAALNPQPPADPNAPAA